jgi:hypothetical protein
MELPKYVKTAGSAIVTAIMTYWAILEIAKNYGVSLTLPTSLAAYWLVLAFVGLTAFPLWVGYQFAIWRNKKKHEPTKPSIPRYVESGTPIIPKNGEPIILTSKLLAGMDFYPSRKELQTQAPIEDVIKGARSSVDLLGFTIESWSVGVRDAIRKSLKDGKHFRFILLSPASKSIKEADDLNQRINLQGRISESLRMLQTIKSELPDVERGRLDIRIHDLLPIHSIVAIDAESESGVIYVEYYMYGTDSRSWVTLSISKKEQGALFDRYWQSYKYVWERSKAWP